MRLKTFVAALAFVSPIASPAFAEGPSTDFGVETSRELPAGLTIAQVTGKATAAKGAQETRAVEHVLSWTDKDGDHVVVFATLQREGVKHDEFWSSKHLYVTSFNHDVVTNKYKEVQAIREIVNPCDSSLDARFLDKAITLTDLDHNGQAELTFGYVTRCAGDISPASKKILMLVGKARYALRGTTMVDLGDGTTEGGSYRADFKKTPATFETHAELLWDKSGQ